MNHRRELVTDWAMAGFVLAILLLAGAYAFGEVPTVILLTLTYAHDMEPWSGDRWWLMLAITLTPALMLLGGLFGLALSSDDR